MTEEVLFLSNVHGEDVIAGQLIDSLAASGLRPGQIAGWAMVGQGAAYDPRGIFRIGPQNLLPSEGFGTLSAGLFLRDRRAGWIGTHVAQVGFARRLRGRFRLMVAVVDEVPLTAGTLSGTPLVFVSCAKSAFSGGRDGRTSAGRMLKHRCRLVFARDALTSGRRTTAAVHNRYVGNPMMGGLPPHDPDRFRAPPRTGVLLLPGSRGGATLNALFLLECLPTDAANYLGLMPCTEAVGFATIRRTLTGGRLGRVAGAGGIARADGTRMRRGRPRDSGP